MELNTFFIFQALSPLCLCGEKFFKELEMILEFRGVKPRLHESVIVMESAFVIGDVEMGAESSVWFGAVVRGDVNAVHIGEKTNLQDMGICHVTQGGGRVEGGSEGTVGPRVARPRCK